MAAEKMDSTGGVVTVWLKKGLLLCTACGVSIVAGGALGWAQSIPQSGVVLPLPEIASEYAPKGLPVGSFRLFPTLETAADYDSNIYRTETDTQSDWFFEISPRVALQSNWANHLLILRGGLTDFVYKDHPRESRTDWDLDAEGRLDVVRGAAFYGGLSYRHTYEPRASPDQLSFAASPTPFDVLHADGRFEYKPNRLGIITGATFDRTTYQPTELLPTGFLNNDDRNFDAVDVFTRLLYEFSPGYSAFIHGAYNVRTFDLKLDRFGVDRDSTGYRINGGVQMEVTRLINGEIYAGFLQQNYKMPLTHDSGINFGADVLWSPTPLIDVRFGASHQINETIVSQGGAIATDSNEERVNLGVDYSFRRNIVLHADGAYLHDRFISTVRTDNLALASFGATYIMNSYLSATASYIYTDRDSTIAGQDFVDNTFRLALGFQL